MRKVKHLFFTALIGIVLVSTIALPAVTSAQATKRCPAFGSTNPPVYCPLATIPGYIDTEMPIVHGGLGTYLNLIVKILVSAAGALAVIMIIVGGVQYMISESPFGKDSGKKTITNAFEGLLLALTAWIILNTINPALLSTQLNSLQPVTLQGIQISSNTTPTDTGVQAVPITSNGGEAGQVSNNNLTGWGDPTAVSMTGNTITAGRQTYYASGEAVSDSNTDAGLGAFGKLVEGTPNVVGSAASVYYPAGTLIKSNGITYIIDDNNLKKQADGSLKAANNNLTNNYTIDIYTSNVSKANSVTTHNPIQVLYVPTEKINAQGIKSIRENASSYTASI